MKYRNWQMKTSPTLEQSSRSAKVESRTLVYHSYFKITPKNRVSLLELNKSSYFRHNMYVHNCEYENASYLDDWPALMNMLSCNDSFFVSRGVFV